MQSDGEVSVASWQDKATAKSAVGAFAIPNEWKLDPAIIKSLNLPLETSKNNLIQLDIPRSSGILTDRELEITTQYDVKSLLSSLAKGAFTALETTIAFSKRAAIAQQLTSCLTEAFFERAQERARHLDALRLNGKLAGPLHGLPISIKDSFDVAGIESTYGLVSFIGHVAEAHSPVIKILEDLGAVLYVKTNIPQTMMTADSHNHIFGRVLNPWNTMLGAGGSSGGEGALIAFRGSPLGIGTDIAGSVRIPALCCGTYGFKPTADRLPFPFPGNSRHGDLLPIIPCLGPLANDIQGLRILMESLINTRPAMIDSTCFDLPWRKVDIGLKPRLKIGVLAMDPTFPLHPPVRRALKGCVDRLLAEGHEVIELKVEEAKIALAAAVIWGFYGLDDFLARVCREAGEPDIPSRVRIEAEQRKLVGWLLPELGTMDKLDKFCFLDRKRAEISKSWRSIWSTYQLDAVVGPGAQNCAVEHDMYGLPPYTSLFNLLDFPACVIPVQCTGEDTPQDRLFELDSTQLGPPYNLDNALAAPCSLQIITNRMRDEECIAIAEVIDACLRQ